MTVQERSTVATAVDYLTVFRNPEVADKLDDSDWSLLLEFARRHGVLPLLRAVLRGRTLPCWVGEALRQGYRNAVANTLRREHDVARLLGRLQEAGIPVIVLKGACLAATVYPDPALRPMADIDLLVQRADLAGAVAVLSALGYAASHRFLIAAEYRGNHHLPAMTNPGGLVVELHWTIASPDCAARFEQADLEGVWQRAEPVTVAGSPARMLAAEDLLLHLCWHFALQHRCNGTLRSLADVDHVVRHYAAGLDWMAIKRRAAQWKIEPAVYVTLRLTTEWFGTAAPRESMNALRPERATEVAVAWARYKLERRVPRAVTSQLGLFAARPRWSDKLRVLRRSLLPSRAKLSRMYPVAPHSPKIVFYYLRHWWDVSWQHGQAAWQVVRGDRELLRWARRDEALRRWLAGKTRG